MLLYIGGGFNSIINIIKNIVNEQTIVFPLISSRFYINAQKTLMKRFNEKLVENEMNYKFISRILISQSY